MAHAPIEVGDEPTALYRFYDADGALLYVGVSRNLVARWAQHAAEKTWWPAVAKKTVVMYGSRQEAELAEGRAIRAEGPLHNKAMGRVDKDAPVRKPTRKKPPPLPLPWEGPRTFDPAPDFLVSIDAYARRYKTSRGYAIGQLVLAGLVRNYHLEHGTMEDLNAEHAAMDAYREARQRGLAA